MTNCAITSVPSIARALLLAGLACGLSGCPNPQQRLDDYGNRVVDAAEIVHVDSMPLAVVPDISGPFLAAIHIAFIGDPVQLIATVTCTTDANGDCVSLTFIGQLLSYPDRTMIIGDPVEFDAVPVSNGGDFTLTKMGLSIPKAANPAGVDATADTTISLTIQSKDDFCGIVTGMVTSPFTQPLDGSTSGAIRIPDGSARGTALPAPQLACPTTGDVDAGTSD